MPKRILNDVLEKAIKDLAKMRGISKEQIINEAIFWYLNFLGAKIEQINTGPIELSDTTIEKLSSLICKKIQNGVD